MGYQLLVNKLKSFDRELKSATGRYDCGSEEGFPLFSIGVIMAYFQGFGKTPVVNDMLNSLARDSATAGQAAIFRRSLLTPSRPGLFPPGSPFNSRNTSSEVIS